MRTALIAAICFFCGAALFAPTKQLFYLRPFASGPYSLKGSQIWHVGPLESGDEFTIPSADGSGRVVVLTGLTGSLEFKSGGVWKLVVKCDKYNEKNVLVPGLVLPGGEYRLTELGHAWGYWAEPGGSAGPSGETYPDQAHIWSFEPTLAGREDFVVPAGTTYVLRGFGAFAHLEVEDANFGWQDFFSGSPWYDPKGPGIPLPSGHYRVVPIGSGLEYVCGWITMPN